MRRPVLWAAGWESFKGNCQGLDILLFGIVDLKV